VSLDNSLQHAAVFANGFVVCLCADELNQPRDGNKKLLEQYSEAVLVRDAQQLAAALNSSLASIGMQSESMAAVRVMAGLTDPNIALLHEMAEKLCRAAQDSRWAHLHKLRTDDVDAGLQMC
jgi:hypothetical protein